MLIAIALSFFFGLVAAVAMAVCARSGLQGMSFARSIRAELAELNQAAPAQAALAQTLKVRASSKASLRLRRSRAVCA